MGNRESKNAAAHAARLAEEQEVVPAAVAHDLAEEHDHARATGQGERWLEKEPHGDTSQNIQPEVVDAVKESRQPAGQEKEALKEAARRQAEAGEGI